MLSTSATAPMMTTSLLLLVIALPITSILFILFYFIRSRAFSVHGSGATAIRAIVQSVSRFRGVV